MIEGGKQGGEEECSGSRDKTLLCIYERDEYRSDGVIEASVLIAGAYWGARSYWLHGNKRFFGTSGRHWADWFCRRTRKTGRSPRCLVS